MISEKSFGYGKYTWAISSPLDNLDQNVVIGLFTWSDAPEFNHRQIDIEFALGADPNNENGQYVVQPWDDPENSRRFDYLESGPSTHSFTWLHDRVILESNPPSAFNRWPYTGDLPVPLDGNARINLGLFRDRAPTDGQPVEIVVGDCAFTPAAN